MKINAASKSAFPHSCALLISGFVCGRRVFGAAHDLTECDSNSYSYRYANEHTQCDAYSQANAHCQAERITEVSFHSSPTPVAYAYEKEIHYSIRRP